MSEKKKQEVPQEAKVAEGVSVADMKKQLDNACAQLRRVTTVLRTQLGMDLDSERDSRTAKVNWLLLPVVAVAGLLAVTFAAMGDQSYEDGGTKDLAHWGKAKITSDGTFKTDGGLVVGTSLTVTGAVSAATNVTVGGNLILTLTVPPSTMTMVVATNAPVVVESNSPTWFRAMIGTNYYAIPGYKLP